MEKLYYLIGKIIVWIFIGFSGTLSLFGTVAFFNWFFRRYARYLWYKIKHLFPKFQYTAEEFALIESTVNNAPLDDWRSRIKIIKKTTRLYTMFLPHYPAGTRKTYLLIQKISLDKSLKVCYNKDTK